MMGDVPPVVEGGSGTTTTILKRLAAEKEEAGRRHVAASEDVHRRRQKLGLGARESDDTSDAQLCALEMILRDAYGLHARAECAHCRRESVERVKAKAAEAKAMRAAAEARWRQMEETYAAECGSSDDDDDDDLSDRRDDDDNDDDDDDDGGGGSDSDDSAYGGDGHAWGGLERRRNFNRLHDDVEWMVVGRGRGWG